MYEGTLTCFYLLVYEKESSIRESLLDWNVDLDYKIRILYISYVYVWFLLCLLGRLYCWGKCRGVFDVMKYVRVGGMARVWPWNVAVCTRICNDVELSLIRHDTVHASPHQSTSNCLFVYLFLFFF